MNDDASSVIKSELAPGEVLLWSGKPRQGVFLRLSDAFFIPFSLLWGGFALFWELSVMLSGAPFFFVIWGIPFVLIGLYMIFGRFFFEARQRADMYYGVTSERILIVTRWPSAGLKSLNLQTLADTSLNQMNSERGTITFASGGLFGQTMGAGPWPGTGSRYAPTFESINDAKKVYEIIRSAQRSAV